MNLELRRKLAELDQRYAMESVVRPVVLIRTEVAVIAADLSVFRKQAQRWHTIYWNPLLKQFDPIRCGRCGARLRRGLYEPGGRTACPACSD